MNQHSTSHILHSKNKFSKGNTCRRLTLLTQTAEDCVNKIVADWITTMAFFKFFLDKRLLEPTTKRVIDDKGRGKTKKRTPGLRLRNSPLPGHWGLSAVLENPFWAVDNWRLSHQSQCSGFAIYTRIEPNGTAWIEPLSVVTSFGLREIPLISKNHKSGTNCKLIWLFTRASPLNLLTDQRRFFRLP